MTLYWNDTASGIAASPTLARNVARQPLARIQPRLTLAPPASGHRAPSRCLDVGLVIGRNRLRVRFEARQRLLVDARELPTPTSMPTSTLQKRNARKTGSSRTSKWETFKVVTFQPDLT